MYIDIEGHPPLGYDPFTDITPVCVYPSGEINLGLVINTTPKVVMKMYINLRNTY